MPNGKGPEFNPEQASDFTSDDDFHAEEDLSEETEKGPDVSHLFENPKFGAKIEEAMTQTAKTDAEHCFLAAINLQTKDILINDLLGGRTHGVDLHYPGFGEKYVHPEGKGFSLSESFHPYFIFHTHPHDDYGGPSPKDLVYLFDVAKQNFNLTPNESSWWVNPIGQISAKDNKMFAYQIPAQKIERLASGEDLVLELGEACLKQLGAMKKRNQLAPEQEELIELCRRDSKLLFVADLEGGGIDRLAGFPAAFSSRDLDKIYSGTGLKMVKFKWSGQKGMIKRLGSFEISPDF